MSKSLFHPGDLLEVLSPQGKKAIVVVVRHDNYGLLIRLGESPDSEIVYVNPYSVKWKKVGRTDNPKIVSTIPTFFFGSSASIWTIESEKRKSYIKGSDATLDELRSRGYVLKVLWHANKISKSIDGTPLVWTVDL